MKIYFIGICGTATGNVAILTKRLGHEVMGSDSGMYEPMKGALAKAGGIRGVAVAVRNGSEYLRSLPDGSESDNLSNLPAIPGGSG